jgi:Flp pilus assembly pilin Flp
MSPVEDPPRWPTPGGRRVEEERVMVKRIAQYGSWLKAERGQALVEYALILALVVLVCAAALATFGENLSAKFQWIVDEFPG